MSSSAISAETEPRPHQSDEGPWYSVDIVDRDGPGSWGCRANSAEEALRKARRAYHGKDCRIVGAKFDKLHLDNRIRGSETKIYRGIPLVAGQVNVYVRDSTSVICRDLKPRLDLVNHSPTGFGWGYAGSGPAQLSLALLADALDDDERALRIYQPFRSTYIANLPSDSEWELCASWIRVVAIDTELQMIARLVA